MEVSVLMYTDVVQRYRVTFGVSGPLIYTSVLDMGRLWERLLRRAGIPLAYTQGFNPHPRLQFASALPVGYSSDCELVDILLGEIMAPEAFRAAIERHAPPGLSILQVEDVPLKAPAPQSSMRLAHYRVCVWSPATRDQVGAALARLLEQEQVIRQRIRKGEMKDYDLRPLISSLEYQGQEGDRHELSMTLACGPQGAGRPEEIIDEIQIPVSRYTIHRSQLVWEDGQEERQ
jgi:radical SAM-linked protein